MSKPKINIDLFEYAGKPLSVVLANLTRRIVAIENEAKRAPVQIKTPPITAESIKVMSPMFQDMSVKAALEDLHRFLYGQVRVDDIQFKEKITVKQVLEGLLSGITYEFNEGLLELSPELGINQVSTIKEALDEIVKALMRLKNETKKSNHNDNIAHSDGRLS